MSGTPAPNSTGASVAGRCHDAASPVKGGSYGLPPADKRFKKGVSGNPRGRPRGSQNTKTILERALKETVQVRDGKTTRSMTKYEAMLQSQLLKAIQGDVRSAMFVQNLVNHTGLFADTDDEIDGGLSKEDTAIVEDYVRRKVDAPIHTAPSNEVH